MSSRFALPVLPLALMLALASCSKPGAHGFHRVELTKEDIVSLFDVPLKESHIDKFEWALDREHYLRVIVERSDDHGRTWTEHMVYPRDLAVVQGTLIYKYDRIDPRSGRAPENSYHLRMRLGGRGIGTWGWTEAATRLEFPAGNLNTESHFNDPERILTLSAGDRVYRLRLEASEKPWVKR